MTLSRQKIQAIDAAHGHDSYGFARAIEAEVHKQDEALIQQLLTHIERTTCTHEETHRGGGIWEICGMCGAKWADDEDGKPEFSWPACVIAARARLGEKEGT